MRKKHPCFNPAFLAIIFLQVITSPILSQPDSLFEFTLPDEASLPSAEYSGLCWHGHELLLLPQYPHNLKPQQAAIFYYTRNQLQAAINNQTPLPSPGRYTLYSPYNKQTTQGFEGYEAVVTQGNRIFLTLETTGGITPDLLLEGVIDTIHHTITLNSKPLHKLKGQAKIRNAGYESLFIHNNRLISLFEANGQNINPNPHLLSCPLHSGQCNSINIPNIEYRITDTTQPDSAGYFWCINYFWPGDAKRYHPHPSPHNTLCTHADGAIEQLLHIKITHEGNLKICQKQCIPEITKGASTNWEGIAQWDENSMLLISDRFPSTRLVLVHFTNKLQ